MSRNTTFHDAFIDDLRDASDAEQQRLKAQAKTLIDLSESFNAEASSIDDDDDAEDDEADEAEKARKNDKDDKDSKDDEDDAKEDDSWSATAVKQRTTSARL